MVGIYCRISKQKEEGRDVSIPVQKKHGIEFAKSQGMEFKLFVDEGISGAGDKLSDRPDFTLLLDAIRKEEISMVFCYDQSRIERNNRIWNMFLSLMLEKKCKYYPGGKFLDLDVPENQFFTGVMSLANELFSALTGIKVRDAIYENARNGKTHGLTAYGYIKGKNGYFEINSEEADVVKRIFKMSLEGIGTYTIANNLNIDGVPTRFSKLSGQIKRKDPYTKQITTHKKEDVRWRGNVIHDIIKNPIYKGTRIWNGESVPVPALMSEEYWQEVNDNLQNNRKMVGKREEYHYLLNGLMFCGECQSEYRGKKRLKGRDSAYKCKGKRIHNVTCNSRGISIVKMENFIIQHLFISKDLQTYLAGLSEKKEETDNLKQKLTREKKELEKLAKIEKNAYKHLLDPDFENDEVIKEEIKSTKQKIKDKEQTIEILENRLIERDASSRIKRINNTIGKFHLDAGFNDTKRLIHSLIKKITIQHHYKSNSKGGYFLINIDYRGFDESSTFMTDWQALKWYWMGHYRSQAITQDDLEDDTELLKYFADKSGKELKVPEDFIGFESYSSGGTLIELNPEEFIYFD
ncbi:MAG: recombinase family protein [Bacteroidales bacterium]